MEAVSKFDIVRYSVSRIDFLLPYTEIPHPLIRYFGLDQVTEREVFVLTGDHDAHDDRCLTVLVHVLPTKPELMT